MARSLAEQVAALEARCKDSEERLAELQLQIARADYFVLKRAVEDLIAGIRSSYDPSEVPGAVEQALQRVCSLVEE
ncbi:MAG: hypothetical protein HC893_00105 [Chloroflexaceae bacterium]|nr:hypothetical protein [Chloroflexaceae bacterium]